MISIDFVYVYGTGGRYVPIVWSIEDNGADGVAEYNSAITSLYGPDVNDSCVLVAPATFLTPANTYVIRVTATNYLNITSTTTITITRDASPSPVVVIRGPDTMRIISSINNKGLNFNLII